MFLVPIILRDAERTNLFGLNRVAASSLMAALLTALVGAHLVTSISVMPHVRELRNFRLMGKAALEFINIAPDQDCLAAAVYQRERFGLLRDQANSADRQGILNPRLIQSARVHQIEGPMPVGPSGVLERAERQGDQVAVTGWAFLPDRQEPADAVLLCGDTGDGEPVIFAVTCAKWQRKDLVDTMGSAEFLASGWRCQFPTSILPLKTVRINAWAFDAEKNRAFRLQGECNVQPGP